MQRQSAGPSLAAKRSPYRVLLSVGLPLLLLLAFLGKQWVGFDRIGLSHGFSHPLSGWDHLVTMLAVGVWAAQLRGRAIWMLPLAFVGVMSLGGLAGAAGLAIPSVEGIILLSCAVFSVLITRKVRFSTSINVAIVAFFAFFHGFAHGQEISTSASLISYTVGFMVATLLLHGAGILVAKLLVLAVTCLLTVLFSNTAIAKAAESSLAAPLRGSPAMQAGQFSADDSFQGLQLSILAGKSDLLSSAEPLPPDPVVLRGSGPGGLSWISSAGSDDGNAFAGCNGVDWTLNPAAVLAPVNHANNALAFEDYTSASRLDFKHYFPDINHTPGTHLSSNGVGLTSPPQCPPPVSASPVFPPRKTPISFDEAFELQSIIAACHSGSCGFCRDPHHSQNGLFLDAALVLYRHHVSVLRFLQPITISFAANVARQRDAVPCVPSIATLRNSSLSGPDPVTASQPMQIHFKLVPIHDRRKNASSL